MSLYLDRAKNRYRIEFTRVMPDGERVRKTKLLAAGLTKEQAMALHDKMETDLFVRTRLTVMTEGWEEYVDTMLADRTSWLHKMVARVRNRTKRKNGETSLTAERLHQLLLRCRGRCEVTGIAFHKTLSLDGRTRPLFHSLDRIDSNKGYVEGNMRLVCYAVNVSMLHWGEDIFGQIATGYVINKYSALGLVGHLKV